MVINIGENIAKIREDMASAAKRSGRALSEIKLMGVTKYHPVAGAVGGTAVGRGVAVAGAAVGGAVVGETSAITRPSPGVGGNGVGDATAGVAGAATVGKIIGGLVGTSVGNGSVAVQAASAMSERK